MEKLDIRPIKGIEDHGVAMQHIDTLMSLDDLSEDQVRDLEVLSILVERYESEHFPVKLSTPVEAIEFRIDQLDLTRSQLAELIDVPKSRVSEVLNGKRSPSLDMMRALHEKLGLVARTID